MNDARGKMRTRIRTAALFAALAAAFIFFCACHSPTPDDGDDVNTGNISDFQKADGDTVVHFLDVGQGDSIIIEFPDGKNMIIDGGDNITAVRNKIAGYITSLGITRFDYVMLTHGDADHSGSLNAVLKMSSLTFGTVYMPYRKASASAKDPLKDDPDAKQLTTAVYRNFVEAAVDSGAEIEYTVSGYIASEDEYSLFVYSPLNMNFYASLGVSSAEDKNAVSPIMILDYGSRRIMFTGDANQKTEAAFVSSVTAAGLSDKVDVDILKVGHHGSATSSTQSFLNLVRPEYSVISVGAGNSYGHPAKAATDRLKALAGYKSLFRTDENGDVILAVGEDNEIAWYTAKGNTAVVVAIKIADFAGVYICLKKSGL